MKKYFVLPLLLFLGILITSCETTTEPEPIEPTGSIFIQSAPSGAQIWVDGVNSNKVTPDSITNLSVGTHSFTLKLTGYNDTTFTENILANFQRSKAITLVSDMSVTAFGPVRIYETSGTTAAQPSGLDLSSGNAYGISSADKDKVDIYYSSNGYLIRSANASSGLTRVTSFFVGTGTNLNDGVDSPLATNSWTASMSDQEANYVFVFDNDLHYSKLKLVGWGGGSGPGDPAWVDVQWLYNNKPNDQRF